ncbi:MAG: endonuclease [Hyphomonadaceae bacterium]|nr:endonuclease [Nitrosomonas nitrosa]MBL8542528.1 endonuclease [Hyphomonadaceae bacterium]
MRKIALALLCLAAASCATAPSAPPPSSTPPPWSSPPTAEILSDPSRLTWARLERMDWPEPQTTYQGYNARVRNAAWGEVYARGGVELYCRDRFTAADSQARRVNDIALTLEHAYPAIIAARFFGFADRDCEEQALARADADKCLAATSDLHNLWPAYGPLNSSHGDSPYGELPGEQYRRFTEYCPDFERGTGNAPDLVDPTDAARGDLARAILYMHYVYGLPFDEAVDDPEHLLSWANDDPVDAAETRRENEIERLQPGTRNPLIGESGVS